MKITDKQIMERYEACWDEAKKISSEDDVRAKIAHILFQEGYKGTKISLIEDLYLLKDNNKGYMRAGWPNFMGFFGRDSIITAWQLLKYDPLIARDTMQQLAEYQGISMDCNYGEEPGKILHEFYPETTTDEYWKKYKENVKWLERGKPFYYSLDSTPLFLFLFTEYYKKTHDRRLKEWLGDSIISAVHWIYEHSDKNEDGFADYEQTTDSEENKKGLLHHSWKDSSEYNWKQPIAPVEVQGYIYAAFKELKELDIEMGLTEKVYKDFVTDLEKKFNDKFWIKKEKYYCIGIDGNGRQIKETASNTGHLLFTGILDKYPDRAEAVVQKLFSEELWTPYGIRTHSIESRKFSISSYHFGAIWPHDNWIIAQGLKRMGYNEKYNSIKNALLKAYDELGYIPENYAVTLNNEIIKLNAQYPQAWASGALLNLILDKKK